MFCTNCGNQMNPNEEFCTNCGTKKEINQKVNIDAPQAPNNKVVNTNPTVGDNNNLASSNMATNYQNNNVPPQKKKHGCLIAFIIFILIIASLFALVFFITKKRNIKVNEMVFEKDYQYLAVDNKGNYYIKDASKDIEFYLTEDALYDVTDENGKTVSTSFSNYKVTNPKGYEEGKTYTITLKSGKFLSDQLINSSKVTFKIGRKEVKKYKYNNTTKFTNSSSINFNSNGKTFTSNNNYVVGDVVAIGNNKDFDKAYYITAVKDNTYAYREAELNEIYSELDVYSKKKVDLSNFEYDEAIKQYVLNDLEQSDWYKSFIDDVYAAPKISVKITPNDDGVKAVITIQVNAGDKSILFDSKYHDVSFIITEYLSIEQLVDLSLDEWNVSFEITKREDFSFKFINKYIDYKKVVDNNLTKDLLEQIKRDSNGSYVDSDKKDAPLTTINIPTEIPGFSIDLDLKLNASISASMSLEYSFGTTTNVVVGFEAGIGKDFTPVFSYDNQNGDTTLKFAGSIKAKLGLSVSVGANFVNTFKANIKFEGGVYDKAEFKLDTNLTKGSYKMNNTVQTGLYAEISLNAKILKADHSLILYSKEIPLINNSWKLEYPETSEEETVIDEFVYEDKLAPNTCIKTEEDGSYEKFKFNFSGDKLKYIQIEMSLNVDTGIDWLDELLKFLFRFYVLIIDIQYRTFGIYEEKGNTIFVTFDVAANKTKSLFDDEEIDFSNYYSVKSTLISEGYTCK